MYVDCWSVGRLSCPLNVQLCERATSHTLSHLPRSTNIYQAKVCHLQEVKGFGDVATIQHQVSTEVPFATIREQRILRRRGHAARAQ